ncbi:tRNA (guanosine(46)-N7)-methyltransferase TrmB [Buchnera aphidicola]|uniref:tRNA (guanine-N(7)-)-methyltransferase n=1 Tax=Buchnera aphidicola subsp. Rhopalosiphum maidis TaxID=118109 RepID=A0A3G2I565_BUCRM|nr:tRNA (guanosine(46)-N7)-methyltransferase TrmB [Buchnera aphidicola]AYN24540.1 tRNA (guanosine(46)-N7)-methyltransferase TrmB [Buchnera aphidicola (Rhopalosiphum maidis)]
MKNNIITPQYNCNGTFLRQNRSFVCRQGRITRAQLRAIEKYWRSIGINFKLAPLNFTSIFQNNAPVILEIGFGSGSSLVKTAINCPDKNFLGIEVYKSGVGSCLRLAHFSKINNLKIIYHDAIEVIDKMILDHTLSRVQIFFPDPWNKKRHHKRRIIQDLFLRKILKKLNTGGILHIVTDSEEYNFFILNLIKNIDHYTHLSKKRILFEQSKFRLVTKFEKKAKLLGNKIFDLVLQSKK